MDERQGSNRCRPSGMMVEESTILSRDANFFGESESL